MVVMFAVSPTSRGVVTDFDRPRISDSVRRKPVASTTAAATAVLTDQTASPPPPDEWSEPCDTKPPLRPPSTPDNLLGGRALALSSYEKISENDSQDLQRCRKLFRKVFKDSFCQSVDDEPFCPYPKPRQIFALHGLDLQYMLKSGGLSDEDADTSVKRIIAATPDQSLAKYLATYCHVPCENALHALQALSDLLQVDASRKISDRKRPDRKLCRDIFGDDFGSYFYNESRKFWPLIIREGKRESEGQNERIIPITKRERLHGGGGGSGAEVYRSTFAEGAFQSAQGDFSSEGRQCVEKIHDAPRGHSESIGELVVAQILQRHQLEHHNIVGIKASLRHDDHEVNEYIRVSLFMEDYGLNLAQFMKQHTEGEPYLSEQDLALMLSELAGAVKHLNKGIPGYCILLRDLKPDNILVHWDRAAKRWRLMLTDFGSALILDDKEQQSGARTQTAANVFGMCTAPEVQYGHNVDFRCDLCSLGCVFILVLIWYSRGKDGLDELQNAMCEGGQDHLFFVLKGKRCSLNSRIQPKLDEALDRMKSSQLEYGLYQALVNLTLKHMLCVDPYDRGDWEGDRNINVHEVLYQLATAGAHSGFWLRHFSSNNNFLDFLFNAFIRTGSGAACNSQVLFSAVRRLVNPFRPIVVCWREMSWWLRFGVQQFCFSVAFDFGRRFVAKQLGFYAHSH